MTTTNTSTKDFVLPALPPGKVLIILAICYILAAFMATRYLTQRPYSGLKLKLESVQDGWETKAGSLSTGVDILAYLAVDHNTIETLASDLTPDPEIFASYAGFNRFMARQNRLASFFQQATWGVSTDEGKAYSIQLLPARPISTLPLGFWINMIAGLSCLLIGASIWLNKRGKVVSRLIVLGGAGLAIGGFTVAIYSSRDIALPAFDFRILHAVNRFAMLTFAASIVSLLWIQPIRLGNLKVVTAIFVWQWLLWLNETLHLIEWPFHSYYPLQMQLPFFVALLLIFLQWTRSKRKPVERAQLFWFFISIFLSSGTAIFLYTVPVIMGYEPMIPLWLGNVVILTIYVGFVLGIMRYRLFDVQRWWLRTWFWFGVIVLVIALDSLLIYWLNLQSDLALGMSLFVVMWIYIPIRDWFWEKLAGNEYSFSSQSRTLERMLDLFESNDQDPNNAFKSWLTNYFSPLEIERRMDRCLAPYLEENGLQLNTPGLEGDSWIIRGKNMGLELFNAKDLKLVNLFWKIYSHALNLIYNREQAQLRERKRIMRDLHDDVGAKLLTLVHGSKSPEDETLARNTLQALRQTVLSLREDNAKHIMDAVLEWRSEVQSRLDIAGVILEWDYTIDSAKDEQQLTAREYINLSKIIREVISNILHHGSATRVKITLSRQEGRLTVLIEQNGAFTEPASWESGTGLENIRTRAGEIGADINWQVLHNEPKQTLQFQCTFLLGAAL